MITSESSMDRISVVSRMLAYQQEQGQSFDVALSKAKSSLSPDYLDSIAVVENIVSGKDDLRFVGYGDSPFNTFAELANIIRKEGGDVSQLFLGTKECIKEAVVQAREYWSGFNSLIVYVVFVFVLAIMVMGIFSVKVLPQFAETFSNFGAELPALTRFILLNDNIFLMVVCILGVGVLLCVLASYHIRKRVNQLRPFSVFFRAVPALRSLANIYSYFLFVHFAHALISAGVKEERALNHAKELAKLHDKSTTGLSSWLEAASSAQKMGVLGREVQYQLSQVNILFNRQMILLRESMTLAVQVFLGVLIGLLVVAMYLPIFMLGSAV